MARTQARTRTGTTTGAQRPARRVLRAVVVLVLALGFVVAGALLTLPGAGAAELREGERLVVGAGEVVGEDLYAVGGEVVVEGTVRGDLVVAAGTVTVTGTVEGDVLAAARTVVVEGTVGDDVRLAGQALVVREGARIGDGLAVAGYSLQTERGSEVGGDVLLAAYQGELAGTVEGSVTAGVEALALAGTVGGDVRASVSTAESPAPATPWVPGTDVALPAVPSGLSLRETARVGGDLSYEGAREAELAPGAEVAGTVDFRQVGAPAPEDAAPAGPLAVVLLALRRLVTLLLVGLLVLWLAPRAAGAAAGALRAHPWLSLGWGVLGAAGAALAAGVLLVAAVLLAVLLGWATLGGLAAAVVTTAVVADLVLVLALVLALSLLAPVVVALAAGGAVLRTPAAASFGRRAAALALGLLAYALLRAVPVLGPLLALAVALFGTGALLVAAWGALRSRRARRARGGPGGPPDRGTWAPAGAPVGPGHGAPAPGDRPRRSGDGTPVPWAGAASGRDAGSGRPPGTGPADGPDRGAGSGPRTGPDRPR
ncbi:polymer-forming cytoskeletal protein [Kocuria flava]|uniref:Polymer-forming cytoskeletal protein n=1 Tax=Kocuria flava TaxID=446860 RepID=A0ABQ0X1C2_9MICC|nr:polymer-forming cytoskeletal protein [Kocuria flava]GEO91368.1 hypothetical protein KFL01_06740 [Kocuria flava]